MQLFYHPDIHPGLELATFSKEESRHMVRVLRKKKGDRIFITDGRGNRYRAELVADGDKRCEVRILGTEPVADRKGYRLHIAMAPTKMNDRFEWFLEKCTEIGIDEITPILCEHSERKKINEERMGKVILSAMKQSLKYSLPRLNPLRRFEDLVSSANAEARLIAHCEDEGKGVLPELIRDKEDILILIGPEGDFSHREIELALSSGFKGLSLGASRLRTETAGVVACSQVSMIKEFL